MPVLDSPGSPEDLAGGVVGIIVTYRPSLDFDHALASYVSQLPVTIVVSNDEDQPTVERLQKLVNEVQARNDTGSKGRVLPIFNHENRGLSAAFNQALGAFKDLGLEFALLLDQDTHLRPGAARALVEEYSVLARQWRVGAMCCRNLEQVQVSGFPLGALDRVRQMVGSGRRGHQHSGPAKLPPEQLTFQNSGTMIAAPALQAVGKFDERLFIDAVDYDYSFRLRKLGFHIFQSKTALAEHSVGAPFSTSLLGRQVRLRTYSPMRSYYIVRDTSRLMRRWFTTFPVEVIGIGTRMLLGVVGSLVFLPDRRDRGHAILTAVGDLKSAKVRPRGTATLRGLRK